jgi:hypothetical protein
LGFIATRIYPQIPLRSPLFLIRPPAIADRLNVEAAGGGGRKEREGRSCSSHWNSKCLLVIASRNQKVFLLRKKAVRNFGTTFESHAAGLSLEAMGSNKDLSLTL